MLAEREPGHRRQGQHDLERSWRRKFEFATHLALNPRFHWSPYAAYSPVAVAKAWSKNLNALSIDVARVEEQNLQRQR